MDAKTLFENELRFMVEGLSNCSSYRLWFVTNDCSIRGSSSVNLIKKLNQKEVEA